MSSIIKCQQFYDSHLVTLLKNDNYPYFESYHILLLYFDFWKKTLCATLARISIKLLTP